MAAIDNVLAYIPKLLYEYINHPAGYVITAEEFNERWNLNVSQGDYTALTLRDLISVIFEGTYIYDEIEEWAGTNLDEDIDAWAASNLAGLIAAWAGEHLHNVSLEDVLTMINTWFDDDATLADLQQIVANWVVANNVIVGNERVFNLMAEYLLANPQTDPNALHVGEYYNGVMINSDYGMVIIRDDELARVQLNSSVFIMQVGDGNGNYTNALYFDPINHEFVFDGKLTADTIVAVTAEINTLIADYIQANQIVVGDDHIVGLIEGYMAENPPTVEGALIEGNYYDGVSISGDYGIVIVRNDETARVQFNASNLVMQVGDGLGNYTNALYFDPATGKYIFDGTLTANVIEAIEAQIDLVVSNTIIAQQLYAAQGNVARLTVDHLLTEDVLADAPIMDYINIGDMHVKFIHAMKKVSEEKIPHTNPDGLPLYWTDETQTQMTTTANAYPILVSQYERQEKMKIWFNPDDPNHVPTIEMGIGSGYGDDYGKGFIYKGVDGLYIEYRHSVTGDPCIFKLTDDGLDLSQFENVSFNENVHLMHRGRNLIQESDYSNAEGDGSKALGPASHAEGESTKAFGWASHAEGYYTTADSVCHAEGSNSKAFGNACHAEGTATVAVGNSSHSEGVSTEAVPITVLNGALVYSETTSFATALDTHNCYVDVQNGAIFADATHVYLDRELYTLDSRSGNRLYLYSASGDIPNSIYQKAYHVAGTDAKAMHAEGYETLAVGKVSHAEGNRTQAVGDYSHAQNEKTIALGKAQTVIGRYNIPNGNADISPEDHAFIIGNGSPDEGEGTVLSNALSVDWEGNVDIAGEYRINGVAIGSLEGLTLGETSTTAYRGDQGKTAYDHSQAGHAPATAQKNSDITKEEIEAKLTGVITSHTHSASYAPLTNGNIEAPELLFYDGDIILVEVL